MSLWQRIIQQLDTSRLMTEFVAYLPRLLAASARSWGPSLGVGKAARRRLQLNKAAGEATNRWTGGAPAARHASGPAKTASGGR